MPQIMLAVTRGKPFLQVYLGKYRQGAYFLEK